MKTIYKMAIPMMMLVLLTACGSGGDNSPSIKTGELLDNAVEGSRITDNATYDVSGTWDMTISKEEITDNPYDYCEITDVGKKLVLQLEQSNSNIFTGTMSDDMETYDMDGTISDSVYDFSYKSNSGYSEGGGVLTLSSDTALAGTVTYQYYDNGQYLCSGKEMFSATKRISTDVTQDDPQDNPPQSAVDYNAYSGSWTSDDTTTGVPSGTSWFYLAGSMTSSGTFTGIYDPYLKLFCSSSFSCSYTRLNVNTGAQATFDFENRSGTLKVPGVGESDFTITSLSSSKIAITLQNEIYENQGKKAVLER